MKISVVVIAHNEERHIASCLESLQTQTLPADEIIVVAHNSTDRTQEIAERYPVRVIHYSGPIGSAYARIKGFEEAQGDLVLCVDGDACAAKNWTEVLLGLLAKPGMVMAGSWIQMSGTLYARLASWRWYFFCSSQGFRATDWMWGASFGIHAKDTQKAIHALKKGLVLTEKLELTTNPDDYWIALFMNPHGTLEVTNKTSVTAHAKEKTSLQGLTRAWDSWIIRKKIHSFLREGGIEGTTLR
ncbi:glycosyltransferase [Patescibacteria group bacterium]|nr:glycosyltransferase [Patescibacteria group bacterium]MBU1500599.1 glycosyltransferase [Patescibacteria group bacterium]MBU2080360.1 glycosyltransferase [Patescibacteria group bacterium]MBU2124228.1 glycosyltransferase [Patescibacteria group bacterium]MBU2194321.1 glycosyltransferase [Patescibacteria group bacterium]